MNPLLLAATAALLPQATAEDLFKQAEAKLTLAKSSVHKVKIEGGPVGKPGGKSDYTGEAKFKEGNRILFFLSGTDAGKGRSIKVICDGKTRLLEGGPESPSQEAARPDLSKRLAAALMRGGWVFAPFLLVGPDAERKIDDVLEVSNFSFGADEKANGRAAKVIQFTLSSSAGNKAMELKQKLWIDAETLALLKREASSAGIAMVETWETAFDHDLPDEDFAVPAKK